MARADFLRQLAALGFTPVDRGNDRVAFEYTIDAGAHAGLTIQLGFVVNDQFPLTPPSGPHLSPALYPLHPQSDVPHPYGGVHESPFGAGWQYWSRPCNDWARTDRSVKAYLRFVRELFAKAV